MDIHGNTGSEPSAFLSAAPWTSLLVWAALLVAVYALQELFFVVLTTFLLAFIVRRIVVGLATRMRPGRERRCQQ